MIPVIELNRGDPMPERVSGRSQLNNEDVRRTVREIIADVRESGDEALIRYTNRFDAEGLTTDRLRVTGDDVNDAYKLVDPSLISSISRARDNIMAFHEKQKRHSRIDIQPRNALGQMIIPLASAGIYVPGGTAPLLSSVMMCALPAKVAGVERIVLVTPPRADGSIAPEILVAAYECGVREIYRVGGAQAIAALAYGTETIAPVDKIVGPGNIYVANAKREVYGHVGIDMIAGPSEIVVVADSTAHPDWVAADLMAQAEHDALAASILITDNQDFADKVLDELSKQIEALPRKDIIRASLTSNGCILLVENMLSAMEYVNQIAPEHLELCVGDPFGLLGWVKNAGACFLGHFTPEPMGDYFAGPNHVLPTSGTARFSSPLSMEDFIKRTSVIRYSRTSMAACAQDVLALARAEGLEAHAHAVEVRLNENL